MPDSVESVSCRICMDPKDSYVSIFSHNLSTKVMEVADVKVEKDDCLPHSICTECEHDLEKCYEFRLKVQAADKKFREQIKLTQVDIVECKIKEERYMDDGNSDNDDIDDKDSGSVDDEHFDDEPDVTQTCEETEPVPDPLSHVVVVEEKETKVEMAENLLNQDDAIMTEEPQVPKIEEVAVDSLECMKEEAETEIMDVDSNRPDPFGPSSSKEEEPAKTTATRNELLLEDSEFDELLDREQFEELEKAIFIVDPPASDCNLTRSTASPGSDDIILQNTASGSSATNQEIDAGSSLYSDTVNGSPSKKPKNPKKRRYDRENFCIYCKKLVKKIRRHFMINHKNELPIAEYLALWESCPKESKERRMKIISDLTLKGNKEYNNACLQDSNSTAILPVKRPPVKNSEKKYEYVSCLLCQGLFVKRHFYQHAAVCSKRTKEEEEKNVDEEEVKNIDEESEEDVEIINRRRIQYLKHFGINIAHNNVNVTQKFKDEIAIRDIADHPAYLPNTDDISNDSEDSYSPRQKKAKTKKINKKHKWSLEEKELLVRRGGSSKSKRNLADTPDGTIGMDSVQPNVPLNDGMAEKLEQKEMHYMPSSSSHFLISNNNEGVPKSSRKMKTKIKRLLNKQTHAKLQKRFDCESFSDSMSQEDNSKTMESDNNSYESDSQSSTPSPKKNSFPAEEQTKKREPFCPVCNVSYESNELLNEHRSKNGFICRVCAEFFNSHLELEGHFTSHQSYNCKVCGEMFFCKIDLYQHKKISTVCNNQVLFQCEICSKKFSRERNLRSHKSVYHSENVENFECIVCRKTFKTLFLLTNHLRHSHVVHEYMECSICHTLCLGPERLKTHFKSHNEESQYPCPDCGEVFNKKSLLRSHMPSHDFSINLCEICGESIRGKVAMKNHIDYKHQTGTFYCNLCNMKFDTKRKMVIHRKSHNRRYLPKPSICEICGKEFTSTQVLKNHLRIHFDERPFKCDICGATFKQKVSLRNHHRTHSDVGQYGCISCGKTFKWKQTYDKHIKNCKFKFECIPGSTSD